VNGEGALEYVPSKRDGGQWIAEIRHFSAYALLKYDKAFEDVPSGHWVESAIKQLAARQIVGGVGEEKFAPERSVLRAEFAAMLVRALRLEATGQASFADVNAGDWFADEAVAAAEAGIVRGDGQGQFRPAETMTREEMAVMLARASALVEGQHENSGSSVEFEDRSEISDWALKAIAEAAERGLLEGSGDNRFRPREPISRAESSQAIHRLLEQ